MAVATKKFNPGKFAVTKVIEVEPAVPPSTEIVLTLTEAEARAVGLLVGRVNGNGPMRRAADNVYYAIRNVLDIPLRDYSEVSSTVHFRGELT